MDKVYAFTKEFQKTFIKLLLLNLKENCKRNCVKGRFCAEGIVQLIFLLKIAHLGKVKKLLKFFSEPRRFSQIGNKIKDVKE